MLKRGSTLVPFKTSTAVSFCNGLLAQLDRVADFYSVGRGFESLRDRHLLLVRTKHSNQEIIIDKCDILCAQYAIEIYIMDKTQKTFNKYYYESKRIYTRIRH
jgi:hypothetical protein